MLKLILQYFGQLMRSEDCEGQEAEKYYRLAVAMDPSLEYRANLDPEMFRIVNNSNF